MINLNKLEEELDIALKLETKDFLLEFLRNLQREVKEENRRIKHPFELFGIECGYGWYGLILPLCRKIERYNIGKEEDDKIRIYQIKEKFGGLRFYISHGPKEFYDWIDRIEDESYKVCEICGSVRDVTTEGDGWVTTLCKQCRDKNK